MPKHWLALSRMPSLRAKPRAKSSRSCGVAIITVCEMPLNTSATGTSAASASLNSTPPGWRSTWLRLIGAGKSKDSSMVVLRTMLPSGFGQARDPAPFFIAHVYPARPGLAAQYRIPHQRKGAHDHAGAYAQAFAQARNRDRRSVFGKRAQQCKRQIVTHAACASWRWCGSISTGMHLEVGVPALAATEDSGTSGLVSG